MRKKKDLRKKDFAEKRFAEKRFAEKQKQKFLKNTTSLLINNQRYRILSLFILLHD
jgi:hypothetical protein